MSLEFYWCVRSCDVTLFHLKDAQIKKPETKTLKVKYTQRAALTSAQLCVSQFALRISRPLITQSWIKESGRFGRENRNKCVCIL